MAEMDITDVIREASELFDKLAQERHEKGQEEYGKLTFLGNDVIPMMMEELADTANYARYQFIKLHILQAMLLAQIEGEPSNKPGVEQLGLGSFKGVGEVGWN